MPPSDLELREQELQLQIARKERDIGNDLEVIRASARKASAIAVTVTAGAALLFSGYVGWQVLRAATRVWQRRRYRFA